MRRLGEALVRRPFLFIAAVSLVVAAIPRLWAAFCDDSVFYPDEIFQTLEQGHRFAFGYGFIPWEFREAARSWLFPGILGIVLRMGSALGLHTGLGLAHFTKAFMVALGLAGGWATLRLAWRRGGASAAMVAGAGYALLPPLVVLGARCTTELASSAVLPFAALLLYAGPRGARRAAIAGALVGLVVFFRYQNGLLALAFFATLLATRRWRDAAALAVAGVGVALLGGALDWMTWGSPFRSMIVYLDFDLVHGGAAHWGTAPWWFYVHTLWTSCGPLVLVIAAGLVLALPTEGALGFVVTAYLAAHFAVPHKQLRFLLPVLPLLLSAAGIGIGKQLDRLRSGTGARALAWAAPALAIVLAASFGLESAHQRYVDMGSQGGRGLASVWQTDQGATLLLAKVGTTPDACGVMLDGIDRGYTGAYAYLHRDVPFFNDAKPDARVSANYLVAPRTGKVPDGYDWIESNGTFALYRRTGPCAPPPVRYSRETGEDPMKK